MRLTCGASTGPTRDGRAPTVPTRYDQGRTALHLGAYRGSLSVCNALLSHALSALQSAHAEESRALARPG